MYPNYIDSKKTVAEGRRIPLSKGTNACMSQHRRRNLCHATMHVRLNTLSCNTLSSLQHVTHPSYMKSSTAVSF